MFGEILSGIGSSLGKTSDNMFDLNKVKYAADLKKGNPEDKKREEAMELLKVILGGASKGKNNSDFGGILAGVDFGQGIDPMQILNSINFKNARKTGGPSSSNTMPSVDSYDPYP